MNKVKVSLVAIVCVIAGVFNANAEFGYGIKAGLNVDKMHLSDKVLDADNRCGFTAGVTAEYIAPFIGVGVDASLMFTKMYSEVSGEKQQGSFFEIPVHLKYKLNIPAVNAIIRPYIFTGPSLAVKLGSKDSFFETRKAQWGWDLGLGLNLIKHLQIGAGYTFGINKLAAKVRDNFNVPGFTTDKSIKVRNNYWTVTAAWMF